MPSTSEKLKLPRLRKVSLRRFSLFAANPNAEFTCDNRVLCLVGANGLGKSTLLSAINFCLTGIVSDPSRPFESMEEYYKFTKGYASSYFRGRISGTDEEEAEIALTFSVGAFDYEVRRGMFEPEELRTIRITNSLTNDPVYETHEEISPSERHRIYMAFLVEHTGLGSFEEFVFLQHFVFTFDEQRKTLFWSPRIMERVLYRAFGLDPNMAKQADTMRRAIDKQDSRVRNYQWEATRMRRRINEIRAEVHAASGAQSKYDALIGSHEGLSKQFEEDSRQLREADDALRDANLRLADCSVKETALREEYSKFFDKKFASRPPVSQHPLVMQSLTERTCGLCGSSSKKALEAISEKSNSGSCPLCDSKIKAPENEVNLSRLPEIDRELAEARQSIKDVHKTLNALTMVHAKAREQWESTKDRLDKFDRDNTTTLEALRETLNASGTELSLKEYRDTLALLEKDKKAAFAEREQLKSHLAQLQRDLEGHYLKVEKTFVPLFSELAQHFLGMPLTVAMDARPTEDVKLVVTVRGTTRRLQQHLSESQRFFLDIALRMALTQHMSNSKSPGGMFIDTPEGSLDIAYEKRAGDMLAKFAKAGHQIIMTANLNSSQLLLALARECGSKGMQLCRMTDWAELSEVQQAEEGLFDSAFSAIEAEMASAT